MFRGFIPIRGKQSLMPFKDKTSSELLTLQEAQKYDEYAGVLADDVVVIDIDNQEQSELLFDIVEDLQLNCRVVETSRGKHFYFKNGINGISKNGTHLRLACGLEADIKIGKSNSYVVLKRDGAVRNIIYDIFEDEGEKYEELPRWLYPVNSKTNFIDMAEGEGRNDAFFKYILVLQSADFTKDEIKECIGIMNEYILKEPLDDKELEVILRNDAFKKQVFFKDKTFLFDKFAMFLKSNNNIVRINQRLHIYKDGVYVQGYSFIEQEMIKHIPHLARSKRTEVVEYLELIADSVQPAKPNYIAFKNGIYDLVEDKMIPFNPEIIVTNKIPHNYNSDAYFEETDKAIDRMMCDDPELRKVLLESLGYCFYRSNILRKSFVLIGNRRNGKSTWFDLVTEILGVENISALDVKEIGDRFRTAEMFGKLANIGDDIDDDYIPSTGVFKKAVAGGRITVEKKGKDPFEFNPYCSVLLSCNDMPRMKDKTGAVLDRLIMIPFDRTFSETDADYDPFIKFKMLKEESLEYLIRLGIEHLKEVLMNNQFTIPQKVKTQNEEYDMMNNPIKTFFEGYDLEGKVNKDAYIQYQMFCSEGGFTPVTQIEFSRQACRTLGLTLVDKRIDGKRYRVFTKD